MYIKLILCIILYLFNIYNVIADSYKQFKSFNSPQLLGNVTDLIVDVGEDVQLECDGDDKSYDVDYEWFRKELHWFSDEPINERIPYKQRILLVNEHKVSTVIYKCISKRTDGPALVKSFRLYADRVPRIQRGYKYNWFHCLYNC